MNDNAYRKTIIPALDNEPEPKEYKVWITIEEHDPNAENPRDEYTDLDLQWAAEATFENEGDAQSFASILHDMAVLLKRRR